MGRGYDGGHGMIYLQYLGTRYRHINNLVGMLFDAIDDEVDFCEKIREISDHLAWI